MDTINGMSIQEYLDKEKSKETSRHVVGEVIHQTKSVRGSYRDYTTTKQIRNSQFYDPKHKNGKVKLYTKGEINRMNRVSRLTENERRMFNIIYDYNSPVSFPTVVEQFHKLYPGEYSRKSMVSMENLIKKLVSVGLIEKLRKQGSEFLPHKPKSFVFLRVLPIEEKPAGRTEEVEARRAEAEPTAEASPPAVDENQNQPAIEMYDYLNYWMDKNDIAELSITIRKRK